MDEKLRQGREQNRDLVFDAAGDETFPGLTHEESLELIDLLERSGISDAQLDRMNQLDRMRNKARMEILEAEEQALNAGGPH